HQGCEPMLCSTSWLILAQYSGDSREHEDVEGHEIFKQLGVVVASRAQLIACGATPRMLTSAVRFHYLERLRRDHYVLPDHGSLLRTAVRCGGIATCV